MPYSGQSFHPPGGPMKNLPPLGSPMWPHHNSSHSIPPMPIMGRYGSQSSGFGPGGFDDVPRGHVVEPSAEFSMKILCSAGKIGGVIGKGGSNVKVVQQDTGASIHVEDASAESDERVIRVSASEALWNPRSQTIDAILQLQNKTSDFSEKGTITTRLLVPSSKVGCILGQGGQVINEMRRRTQADIRVYSKDEKPKCASEDEELVQISGKFGVAKDALAEIASRLRVRTLRDVNAGAEPGPVGPIQGFGAARSLPGRGSSGMMGASSSGGYEPLRDTEHEYESHSYPVPPAAVGPRYRNVNSALDANISKSGVNSVAGAGGMSYVGEVAGTRMKLQDPLSGGYESFVEFRGSSERLNAPQGMLHPFGPSAGHNMNPQQGPYQSNMTVHPSSYQNASAQQSVYQNVNSQQSPYQNMNMQQSPYSANIHLGVYASTNAPQATYHNISAQQGTYQY